MYTWPDSRRGSKFSLLNGIRDETYARELMIGYYKPQCPKFHDFGGLKAKLMAVRTVYILPCVIYFNEASYPLALLSATANQQRESSEIIHFH